MHTTCCSKASFNTLLAALLLMGLVQAHGSVIYQGPGSAAIAFEAESFASVTNSPPTMWVLTNEVAASGGQAIYQAGDNGTTSSSSFAEYALVFT